MDAGFLQPLELLEIGVLDQVHLLSLEKYSPDQPRVPAGQTGGGQWMSGETGEGEKPDSVPFGVSDSPLDNKVAIAGVLIGRVVDHKAGIIHCTYSSPFGTFTIEFKLIIKCDPTFPYPF